MITFETQEDFEDAVLDIIANNLEIVTSTGSWGDMPSVRLRLNGITFSEDSLPTPQLKY